MRTFITESLERLIVGHERNLSDSLSARYFEAPLVGLASGEDPLFVLYQSLIGPWHGTPQEAFESQFGNGSWRGGTVVSWVTPWSKQLRDTNRVQSTRPSREWTTAYNSGIQKEIRAGLVTTLTKSGVKATSPVDSEWFEILDTPSGKVSCWSERHVAFAAGLGTFGLNRAFISEVGTSIVLNSEVMDAVIEPTPRSAESYLANCLHHNGNNCSACIRRCPAGAISENGHNKAQCASYGYGAESTELAASYGIKGRAGCALCQSGVPCEATNPSRPRRANVCGEKLALSGG